MSDNWTSYCLRGALVHADIYAQALLDAGCEGVQIDDSEVRLDDTEDALIEARPWAHVVGYLPGEPQNIVQQQLQKLPGSPRLTTSNLAPSDWENEWKQSFPPLHIGPFLILPSWQTQSDGETAIAATVIRLDPGLAFGTGQHPTTRLCLELLAEQVKPGIKVLDVGCGSGILSVAAAKLGGDVLAVDLDRWCVLATKDNAVQNSVAVAVVRSNGLTWLNQARPLVVANLASATLVLLANDLANATAPGGSLIVSGISLARADEVQAALASTGLRLAERRDAAGDWRGSVPEVWVALRYSQG